MYSRLYLDFSSRSWQSFLRISDINMMTSYLASYVTHLVVTAQNVHLSTACTCPYFFDFCEDKHFFFFLIICFKKCIGFVKSRASFKVVNFRLKRLSKLQLIINRSYRRKVFTSDYISISHNVFKSLFP